MKIAVFFPVMEKAWRWMPKGSCMIEIGNDGDREEQNKPDKAWWTDTEAEETHALMTKYNSL